MTSNGKLCNVHGTWLSLSQEFCKFSIKFLHTLFVTSFAQSSGLSCVPIFCSVFPGACKKW